MHGVYSNTLECKTIGSGVQYTYSAFFQINTSTVPQNRPTPCRPVQAETRCLSVYHSNVCSSVSLVVTAAAAAAAKRPVDKSV